MQDFFLEGALILFLNKCDFVFIDDQAECICMQTFCYRCYTSEPYAHALDIG